MKEMSIFWHLRVNWDICHIHYLRNVPTTFVKEKSYIWLCQVDFSMNMANLMKCILSILSYLKINHFNHMFHNNATFSFKCYGHQSILWAYGHPCFRVLKQRWMLCLLAASFLACMKLNISTTNTAIPYTYWTKTENGVDREYRTSCFEKTRLGK